MPEAATPNAMPGAQKAVDDTDKPSPATETATAPATAAQPSTPAANSGLSADERAELDRLREVHKDEQKWRRQATENHSDAEKYRKLLDGFGVAPDKGKEFDAQQAVAELNKKFEKAERARLRSEIARTEGVDPDIIIGATEDDMRASAKRFKATVEAEVEKRTKKPAPSAAPASDVTANGKVEGPKQITNRDDLKNMTTKQIIEAREKGLLDDLQQGKSA